MNYEEMWNKLKEQVEKEFKFSKRTAEDSWDEGYSSGIGSVLMMISALENKEQ